MLAVLIVAMVLLASLASAWAAPVSPARNAPDTAPSLSLPDTDPAQEPASPAALQFHEPRSAVASIGQISRLPILAASPAELHYQPDAYTLTHFDPTNLQVFGGTVGGNGVKGGAVVSLTWPIER